MVNVRRQQFNGIRRPDEPPPHYDGTFPGDPGRGNLLLGHSATGSRNSEFTRMDAILNTPYGIARCFDGGSGTIDWTVIDYHKARGRVVAYSVKNNGAGVSNSDLANMNAAARSWVDGLCEGFLARPRTPIGFVIHHEPDEDITTSAEAEVFRLAKRQMYHRMKVTNGVTTMTWMDAVWMGGGSFGGNWNRDWRFWSGDWKGTSTGGSDQENPNPADFYLGDYVDLTHGGITDVLAFDLYNFWGVQPTANWVLLSVKAAPMIGALRAVWPDKPMAHLEFACAAYCGDNTHANESWSAANRRQTEAWCDDAYQWFLDHDVRWACWFTSFDTATHLDNYDPNQWRYQKLAEMMRRPTSVRVPVT